MRGLETAVPADVQIPALVRRDHAHVLAAGLGAFAGASGDAELELVRAAQPAVAQLQGDRHADRVLHAVAAPGGSDAALDVAQRLAVGLPGLEARLDQLLPDRRELIQPCPEEVDPLAARDLGVEPEVLRHPRDHGEFLGSDLAARDARHDRVRPVLLHVRECTVVGVLQRPSSRVQQVLTVLAGEDRAHDGLADVAAATASEPRERVLPTRQTEHADGLEQLLAGLVEMLAERARNGGAHGGELGLEQLLHQRDAGSALRPRAGARLERAEFVAAVGDRPAHAARGDVVARAHESIVRQRAPGRRLGAGRRQVRGGFGVQRPPEQRAQARVRGGVAHEDPAQQGLGVVAHDELLVQPAGGVRVHDLERAGLTGEGVAEARDVHSGQLELGGVVDDGERRVAAEQPVGDGLRHGVRGCDQPDRAAVDRGHLSDRPDRRVGAAARVIDDHPAALRGVDACGSGQFVAGTDADREHDDVRGDAAAVRAPDGRRPPVVVAQDPLRPRAQVQIDAARRDEPAQGLARALVELRRHQPSAGMDDHGLGAESGDASCRLQPQQSSARDGDPRGPAELVAACGDLGDQCVHVGQGAVDQGRSGSGDVRDGRCGSGRQDEVVVAEHGAVRGGDRARGAVDRHGPLADPQGHRGVVPAVRIEGEVGVAVGEAHAQLHAVVGLVGLLGEDGDEPVSGAAGDQGLHEAMGGGAAPGDQGSSGRHACPPPCRWIRA